MHQRGSRSTPDQSFPVRLFGALATLEAGTSRVHPDHLPCVIHQKCSASGDGPGCAHGLAESAARAPGWRKSIDDDMQGARRCAVLIRINRIEADDLAGNSHAPKAGSIQLANHTPDGACRELHGSDDEDRLVRKSFLHEAGDAFLVECVARSVAVRAENPRACLRDPDQIGAQMQP